ncbi:RecX family transcriptional regulator [bacterium]|nr:RecX family transcriptional regulator [bacterium]
MSDESQKAFDSLGRLLQQRRHSRAELKQKLVRKGFSAHAVSNALMKAEEYSWINDTETARAYIEEQIRKGGHGRRWVTEKLRQKAVSPEIISDVMLELWSDDVEFELAQSTLVKWLRTSAAKKETSSTPLKHKAGMTLLRRGFEPSTIQNVCESLEDYE